MEKIVLIANDFGIATLVDAVAAHIKKLDCPSLNDQKVRFINGHGRFWDNWYVSTCDMAVIGHPFLAMVSKGKHFTTPKGVVYRCMSGRDATFMIGDNIYYMSV